MSLKTFQITHAGNISLAMQAGTLDELTRILPQGFYTTFNTSAHGTRVMGLHNHLQRLYAPAAEMKLKPSVNEHTLRERIALLVKENLPHESRVRLILAKDSGKIYIGIQLFTSLPRHIYENGVHAITSSVARHDPRIKDTGFILESAEQRKLLNKDVFEILLTKNGNILEGMTSNFYIIANGAKQSPRVPGSLRREERPPRNDVNLITAQRGILLGVTRRAILKIARGQGMRIEYRAPNIAHEKFDEAFLTSSSRGVVPIVLIDDKPVGQGRVGAWTKSLMQAYWEYVGKQSEDVIK